MKYVYPLMFCLFVASLASACDPFLADQIREQAKAQQIAAQSQQEALSAEQARQHAQDFHAIQIQDEARKQARKDALEPVWRLGWTVFLYSLFICGVGFMVYATAAITPHSVAQLIRIQEGFATAMITRVDINSRLIYLDTNTRQFPLLYQYNGHGRYLVTDPNTKVTMELDTRNEGDAQLIAGAIAIRHSGMLAMEQRKSGAKDAASMAMVQPPIIEGTADDVKTIALDILKRGWSDE